MNSKITTMPALVSIVIPTYRSRTFIRETVESIRAQSYPRIETILVDDGSPDDTVAICRALPGSLTVIEQANAGRGAARNRGLNAASGEFVAFLDHDDLLLRTSIEERVRFLEDHSATGWVFTDATEFDETGDLRLYLAKYPWLDLRRDAFIQLLRGIYPLTSTVMARRDLLGTVGGFREELRYGEDIDLFMKLALVSPVGMLAEPLTRRRMHADQGSTSTFDRWDSRVRIFGGFQSVAGHPTAEQAKALRTALRHAHFKLAEWHWETLALGLARRHFMASVGWYPWTPAAFLYGAASLLPPRGVLAVRRAKSGRGSSPSGV